MLTRENSIKTETSHFRRFPFQLSGVYTIMTKASKV